eukprot:6212851-Pleurochrysis_carterae.AAC.1
MSTLSKSDTGPSSSTFHREARSVVNVEYRESGEDTRIGRALAESPCLQPRKQGSLPTASSLRHAVYGLEYAADAGFAVGTSSLVARWRATICRYEVPTTHGHPTLDSESGERAEGGGPHRCAERLRTRERPEGTEERSMSSQLPLLEWFAIFVRSAAVQPARSSRRACFRVLGSKLATDATRAAPLRSTKGRRGLRT